MKNFRISKEISSLKPRMSTWYLIALLSIFLPNNGMHASNDDGETNSDDIYGPGPTPTSGIEDEENLSNQTDTGGTDNEDIDELRDRIKKINFKSFKTRTKKTPETPKKPWKNSPHYNLNKALKKIKINIPTDYESQNFINAPKKKITVYKLLKKLLYKNPKSNNSSENIEEELEPLKTSLEQCPVPLLRLLNKTIEKYCRDQIKEIEDQKISSILNKSLGEHYYYQYLQTMYRLKYPKGHYRTHGTNLLYAVESCNESDSSQVPFDSMEIYKKVYGANCTSSEDDTNTVILCDPPLEKPDLEPALDTPTNNDPSVPVHLYIIFASSTGLGYYLHKKRKKNKREEQIEGDTTYIENEDNTQKTNTAEIGETDT